MVLDTDVNVRTDARNLVLLGGPASNTATAALVAAGGAWPPVSFDVDGGYTLGSDDDCTHHGPGLGIGFVVPLPAVGGEARLGFVLDGTDSAGLRRLVSFSYTSNQPLTRAAFTNMFPDFVLAGPDYAAQGYGGVLAAGFWGPDWDWSGATSFTQWCS